MDAKVAFVVSGWGVLFPLERYKLAKARATRTSQKSHDTFFRDEQTQIEATPALAIERGEKVYLPPALVFQGTADEWTTVELAQRFAADYRNAGGTDGPAAAAGRAPHLRQRAPVFAQLGEGGGDDESVHQEIRLGNDVFELITRCSERARENPRP